MSELTETMQRMEDLREWLVTEINKEHRKSFDRNIRASTQHLHRTIRNSYMRCLSKLADEKYLDLMDELHANGKLNG